MEKVTLPSRRYIKSKLYDQYAVPPMIRAHCDKVRDVAMTLAEGMSKDGVDINLNLVDRLALVHDAMKAVSLPTLVANPDFDYIPSRREIETQTKLKGKYAGIHETLIAADLLKPKFPKFSEYVANIGSTGNPTYFDAGVEIKVAHYADWRVQFTSIVPFADRLNYLQKTYLSRYPEKGDEWWQAAVKKEVALEQDIFSHLPYKPDDLAQVVERRAKKN